MRIRLSLWTFVRLVHVMRMASSTRLRVVGSKIAFRWVTTSSISRKFVRVPVPVSTPEALHVGSLESPSRLHREARPLVLARLDPHVRKRHPVLRSLYDLAHEPDPFLGVV